MSLILITISKRSKLNNSQLKTLVNIYVNLGALCFGSIVIPSIFGQVIVYQFFAGLIVGLYVWYTAIRLSKKII